MWLKFIGNLNKKEQNIIEVLIETNCDDWKTALELCWINNKTNEIFEEGRFPSDENSLVFIKNFSKDLQKQQKQVIISNVNDWFVNGRKKIEAKGLTINQLYNQRGSKGGRRNSIRNIVKTDFEAFTDFFPVLMLNPETCSSILPLKRGIFDIVIFDEASQLRVEDTFTALLRGMQIIVSGDSQQMPPSSHFSGEKRLLDSGDDEDNTEDEIQEIELAKDMLSKESLLELALDGDFIETYLDMHYRSKHPDLIEFSNTCFYKGRLIPMPATSEYTAIRYQNVSGTYENSQNVAEAHQIIHLIKNELDTRYSLGIATFNIQQRNLILSLIAIERTNDIEFNKKMSLFDSHAKEEFFVKNLENIQGDERDIILISTTFGKKKDGKFLRNFGPIGQRNGHRLLNVIVTRAKHYLYVITSIPQQIIDPSRSASISSM
jgi:superfamily I DNA and/or RNA helicase